VSQSQSQRVQPEESFLDEHDQEEFYQDNLPLRRARAAYPPILSGSNASTLLPYLKNASTVSTCILITL